MNLQQTIVIVVGIVLTIVILAIVIRALQAFGLSRCRGIVYKAFVTAENHFEQGNDKFEYVISVAKNAIPKPLNLIITDKVIRRTIQLWFDICKDLLDDGRVNNTKNYKALN